MGATCVRQLFNNHKATCKAIYNSFEPIIEVYSGLIVITDQSKFRKRKLHQLLLYINISGTYLVTFGGEFCINGTTFCNKKVKATLRPGIPSTQFLNLTKHLAILSLPYLRNIILRNLEHIEKLHEIVEKQRYLRHVKDHHYNYGCSIIILEMQGK